MQPPCFFLTSSSRSRNARHDVWKTFCQKTLPFSTQGACYRPFNKLCFTSKLSPVEHSVWWVQWIQVRWVWRPFFSLLANFVWLWDLVEISSSHHFGTNEPQWEHVSDNFDSLSQCAQAKKMHRGSFIQNCGSNHILGYFL